MSLNSSICPPNLCVLLFFFVSAWIMNFLDKHPSENCMEFTKLKVACKYASIGGGCISRWFTVCCVILLRKMNCFCPWDFVFRTALSGLRAEICIESKWVCSHIKLSYDLEQNVMDAKTQFDMAVNPLWFNINLKTSAKTWREHCGSSLLECTFLWVLFLWIILTKLRWIRARGRGL